MATQLVTPEAVVLGFDTAGLPTRMLARLLDVAVQTATLFGALFGLTFLSRTGIPDVALTIAAFFLVPLVIFGYPIISETLWRGRTLGKAALGLRVVTVEGAPIRFRHALIRGGGDMVDLFGLGVLIVAPGIVGLIAIAASKRNQRLGDMVAGTIVVRERSAAPRTAPTSFVVPPGYESYAATIDVSGLQAGDYQAVRSYLLRASTLRPDARSQVAADLARSIAGRIRHVPPPGVHPELFLVVVAANFQGRGGPRPDRGLATGSPPLVPGGWGAVPAWPGSAPLGVVPPAVAPPVARGWGGAAPWPGTAAPPDPPPGAPGGFIPPG